MVFLSLMALPVLMRLFTWTTGQVADSAGGGGFLQTALGGAVAIGALRGSAGGSGGSGAAEQARLMSAQLGPQGTGPSGASAPGTGVRNAAAPVGTSAGAAPNAAAASTSTSAAAGAAAGPGGVAASGLAAGAASARRKATDAIQPPDAR
jgi:hypothetical protein